MYVTVIYVVEIVATYLCNETKTFGSHRQLVPLHVQGYALASYPCMHAIKGPHAYIISCEV